MVLNCILFASPAVWMLEFLKWATVMTTDTHRPILAWGRVFKSSWLQKFCTSESQGRAGTSFLRSPPYSCLKTDRPVAPFNHMMPLASNHRTNLSSSRLGSRASLKVINTHSSLVSGSALLGLTQFLKTVPSPGVLPIRNSFQVPRIQF